MAREKIQIKKIDNATARQVTFSKRRRGLFKKAEELAILCDAEVGVIVFSSSGKLFEFSSSSMKQIIEKQNIQSNTLQKPDQLSADLQVLALKYTGSKLMADHLNPIKGLQINSQVENGDFERLSKELENVNRQLSNMRGDDLQGLTIAELQKLEKGLESSLHRILHRKSEQIVEKINDLQKKGLQLMQENAWLRKQVAEMSTMGMQGVAESENDGQSSDSITNISHTGSPPENDDSSDTSLRLGLYCVGWK